MTISRAGAAAVGIGLGVVADRVLGDPRRGHPVAGFGRVAAALEQRMYADDRRAGAGYLAMLVGGAVLLGVALERLGRGSASVSILVTAAATWATLGGRSLQREAGIISEQLTANDLAAARIQIRHLVGRDPATLGSTEIVRACVESIAENTSDAVVAPLLWGAIAGVPGLLGYRAANTLDAMVGHHSTRYQNFGWAAARFDDVLNWVPARLTGLAAALCAPAVAGSAARSLATVVRDSARHPSPNAGVVEAAFAGALDVQLGGVNSYAGRTEDRGVLGRGRPVRPDDIGRATRLASLTATLSVGLAVGLRWAMRR
jgi:adenosylcobinamide-phosphate synthase